MSMTISVNDDEAEQNIREAIGEVEEELGKDVSTGRGKPASNEISVARAIEEMALAYKGDVSYTEDPYEA